MVREENLPISEARCRSCVSSSIEDITHLLLECPAYIKHREKLVKDLDLALDTSSLENWKFSSMSTSDQLDLLLGRSTGSAIADDRVDKIAKRYLKKVWRSRKWLTVAINNLFARQDTVWALKWHGD